MPANLTGSILLELNQELGEVQVVALQYLIDYLLLKEHMGCEQFPGMGCFNLSDFSQPIQIQLENIHHIIVSFHKCLGCLTGFLGFTGDGW